MLELIRSEKYKRGAALCLYARERRSPTNAQRKPTVEGVSCRRSSQNSYGSPTVRSAYNFPTLILERKTTPTKRRFGMRLHPLEPMSGSSSSSSSLSPSSSSAPSYPYPHPPPSSSALSPSSLDSAPTSTACREHFWLFLRRNDLG